MRLPSDEDRISIIGQTGTGKTVAAAWHLSKRDFESMPWIIFDFKGDKLISKINAREIDLDTIPTKPGLYVVHPRPDQGADVESFLWKIWERGGIGLWIDEGYMMAKSKSFNAILTQGRSKRIPCIILSQRPVWMSVFVFTESQFFQVFHLNDKNDRIRVKEFTSANIDKRLPKYHSYYYDVEDDNFEALQPVPKVEVILERINSRLTPPPTFMQRVMDRLGLGGGATAQRRML